MPENVSLAVQVALATGRPLLLRGDPGSGKSSLAAHVALKRGWRYYEQIVTSRTQAQDLLWSFDSIKRLGDAQLHRELDDRHYVEPGVLWWAFAPESASRQGHWAQESVGRFADPWSELNRERSRRHAVVLIDEIDKADPDLPNGLLVPLGSNQFVVTETGSTVRIAAQDGYGDQEDSSHLIVVTTNEERELPQAFLRRCVVVWLEHPDQEQLVEIARKHFEEYTGGMHSDDLLLATELADAIVELRELAERRGIRKPSTAEFLDALRACRRLGISVHSARWAQVRDMVLVKQQQPD